MKNKKTKIIILVTVPALVLLSIAAYFVIANKPIFGFCRPGTSFVRYLPNGNTSCVPNEDIAKPSIYVGRECTRKSECGTGFCLTTENGNKGRCSDDLPAGLQYYFDENGLIQESFFVI